VQSEPKKILIVALCGIGDTLSFVPHLQQLRARYPNVKIDFLVHNPRMIPWLRRSKLCDKAWVVDDRRYVFNKDSRWKRICSFLSRTFQIRREQYDLAFWPYAQTTWKKIILARLLGVRCTYMHTASHWVEGWLAKRIVFVPFSFTDAVLERNTGLLMAHDTQWPSIQIQFSADLADAERGRLALARFGFAQGRHVVGFHPGGNVNWTPYRQWPAERYSELADRLCETLDADAVLIGQPEEIKLLEHIRSKMKRPVTFITDTTFEELVDVMAALHALVGNESAMVHLAGFSGIPSFSLVGATNYRQTGPWGQRSYVVRLDLPCSPCFETGYTSRCPHRKCMADLTVDRVAHTILPIILDLAPKNHFKPAVISIPVEVPNDAQWQQFMYDRDQWSALRI